MHRRAMPARSLVIVGKNSGSWAFISRVVP